MILVIVHDQLRLHDLVSRMNDLYNNHITQTDGRPTVMEQIMETRATSADCRPTSASILVDIFFPADDFFVEASQFKVSLTYPPIFIGFVLGEASDDGRPMIGRPSADVLKKFTERNRPKFARSSGVNRPTIARQSVDHIKSKNRRHTDAVYRP